ncbi:MAG TPA: universal stress protein [Pseudonocardiaceae bacterium]|nr:universal stress protein [Pseudonocardiaceae bacterium]
MSAPGGPLIVVGVDGSPAAYSALRWAVESATRQHGTVRAVSIRRPDDFVPSDLLTPHDLGAPERDTATTMRRLRELIEQARSGITDPAEVTPTVTIGNPETDLVNAAADADLVVVGGHGKGPRAEVFLGDVAAATVRHAPCPVAIIPAPVPDRFPPRL